MSATTVAGDLGRITDDQQLRSEADALTHQWTAAGFGVDTVAPVLLLIEAHPDWDFGMPGDLVRYVERFYMRGYEDRLIESLRRHPTPHTLWMLNRIINGERDEARKRSFVELLAGLADDRAHGATIVALATDFLSQHK